MTAKEYLGQLKSLERKIHHKKMELKEAESSVGISFRHNGEHVQTSFSGAMGDYTGRQAVRILSLKETIDQKIIEYLELKNQIVDQIHDLREGIYIDILYRHYVREDGDFAQIADDMGYSYKYIINKHGEALSAFERIHPELFLTNECK
ncbi:hypothetical protein [Hominifimenecus sp. rT4P-3]|uniref:hypothetical protein n=1 Tax=Hominifimenecus sp. rT4P-3 TaxID=3242979 RepID=UPI003DA27B05